MPLKRKQTQQKYNQSKSDVYNQNATNDNQYLAATSVKKP